MDCEEEDDGEVLSICLILHACMASWDCLALSGSPFVQRMIVTLDHLDEWLIAFNITHMMTMSTQYVVLLPCRLDGMSYMLAPPLRLSLLLV